MTLSFDECNIGSYISGYLFCGQYASGIILSIFPGLGFLIENEGYQYMILNKFSNGSKMRTNFLQFGTSDSHHICLTDDTILFWLKGGCHTKSKIYGIEVTRRYLINPMSSAGIRLRTKLSPFIRSELYKKGMETRENWNFIKNIGSDFPEVAGDAAPLPYESIYNMALEKQENQWHLARARILNDDETKPYKYTFLQCGKKLLIESNGIKKATVNYEGGDVHHYTPAHSVTSSPKKPFTLTLPKSVQNSLPHLALEDPLWGGDNKFVKVVKRLTNQQINDGIEEAHWEMKRIRVVAETTNSQLGVDFMNTHKWLDAAYDEKQYRREYNEKFGEQAVFNYIGID